jgi:hypothetical protein
MDRDHRVAGGEQGIDDQAGWPLDGDRQFGRGCDALNLTESNYLARFLLSHEGVSLR